MLFDDRCVCSSVVNSQNVTFDYIFDRIDVDCEKKQETQIKCGGCYSDAHSRFYFQFVETSTDHLFTCEGEIANEYV